MQARKFFPFLVLLAFQAVPAQAQAPLPAGWPNRVELGMADGPGGAAAMRATAPVRLPLPIPGRRRQHGQRLGHLEHQRRFRAVLYPGLGGQRDHPGLHLLHDFSVRARRRQRERRGLQQPEQHRHDDGVLQRPEALLSKGRRLSRAEGGAARGAGPLGLHGAALDERRCQDRARESGGNRDCRSWRACRATCPAFARAVLKLRDAYAPNVNVGYHISVWGTGIDIALVEPLRRDGRRARRACGHLLQVARRRLRHRFRRVQRPRLGLLPVRLRRRRPVLVGRGGFPPQRALPRAASPPLRESES